jgi:hypothetical protein
MAWALVQHVTPGDAAELGVDYWRKLQAVDAREDPVLAAKAKQAAMTGKYELFKTTSHFDSTAKNPSWLGWSSHRV